MYNDGYIQFCNELTQDALELTELPAMVVSEINERLCRPVDPATNQGGWSHRCRACQSYMTPLKSIKYYI